jgi:hypothetical protein
MPRVRRKHKFASGIIAPDAARMGEDPSVPTVAIDFVHDRAQQWRREIVLARIKLADEYLSPAKRAELWQVVDCREWCLRMLVADFPEELELIDREIEHELRR